ncbi:MAG: hypothetical protein ACJ8FE_04410 [Sphingomicrobium sp.]
MAEDVLTLQQPTGEGGVEIVNFFNGRLLSGGDLGREQIARRRADARLGEAFGDGVAFGFDVTVSPSPDEPLPILEISAGLAINRAGSCLRLSQPRKIRLSRTDSTSFASAGCAFDECVPLSGGTYVAGEGLYMLTVAPAEIALGRAPSNGLGGIEPRCDIDRRVEAVQFRLLEIPTRLYSDLSAADSDFRNAIAYRCFGPGVRSAWATDLLGSGRRQDGVLDEMAAYGLSPLDVPLALLGFSGAATLTFVDSWAVRRPLAPADPTGQFHSLGAPRRPAVGRAMLAQFQAHFEDLRKSGLKPGDDFTARSHFRLLPPVGILPRLTADKALEFFGDMTIRGPVHINSPTVEPLVRESLSAPAIRTASAEVVWLYAVAENLIAATEALADDLRPDPYLIFSSANLAYRADARFNLHRWNYANFALGGS